MLRLDVLLLLVGMLLATYIPRMLPAVFVERFSFGGKLEKLLKLIPYTAMAALVFPGAVFVDPVYPWIGVVGVAVAGVLSYLKCPMTLSVLCAIGTNLVIYLII